MIAGPEWFFEAGGVSGALARSIDWSRTPLGPAAAWPQTLKATLAAIFHARQPMFLWWGPDLVQFYNDAYLPSFGQGKHPAAMGQQGRDCWQEIWPIIWPQIDDVMSRAKASWNEDQLVPIQRNGRLEEVFWTYSYTPVFAEQGVVAGTLVICTETTARVLAERRISLLGTLVEALAAAETTEALLHATVGVLAAAAADVPFAVFCKGGPGEALGVRASCGLPDAATAAALVASVGAARSQARDPRIVSLAALDVAFFCAPWPERCAEALVIELDTSFHGLADRLVLGLSPRLSFDGPYRHFVNQIVDHLNMANRRLEAAHLRKLTEAERDNLLKQAPVATALLTGPEHRFVLANPRFRQMVGRPDLVGKTFREAFPELQDTPLPPILDRVYQTGAAFATDELRLPLDRGATSARPDTPADAVFKFNLEALRSAAGTVHGMMAVAIDITELVNARRVLERAHVEREGLLRDLESANRAKDEFLAMLGHELRNPLSPIVTALQLLRRRSDGRTSKAEDIIQRQVDHLVRLVDDLLDVSKITRGKLDLRLQPLDLADVIAKGIEIASFLLEARGHRLEIDVPRGELHCQGDPVRLAQVFANLLTNAARYSPPGGRIVVSAAREGEALVVRVTDFGIGIQPDMLARIFDLFVQAKRSADRAEGGLGIGLALVKNLVTLHGGTTWAKSDGPGTGSEFFVRLPATAPTTASAPEAGALLVPLTVHAGTAQRVLLVDDNADAVEMLRELLIAYGHDVTVAGDAPAALELSRRLAPDVAILDIGLPIMDGYELATRLREQAGAAPLRLIALSGYGQEHDRRRSAEAGFECHLVKPVDVERLARLLEQPAALGGPPREGAARRP